jgi:hypothetical protein
MPVCVDCHRWSPGTFKSCPDCSGLLELEPEWARPSSDPELANIDRLAEQWHREARAASSEEASKEAMAAIEGFRRKYEEMHRRLLPMLEAAETRRAARVQRGARAKGLTIDEYEAQVAREQRGLEEVLRKLGEARTAGRITQREYEAGLEEGRSRAIEEGARADGVSVRVYRERISREERERDWLRYPKWTDSDRFMDWLLATIGAVVLSCIAGLILTAVFILGGRSPSPAIGGTILGGVAGMILAQTLFLTTAAILGRLVLGSRFVRQIADALYSGALLVILLVPPGLALILALGAG